MPAQVICSQWFLCIFSNRLPCETVCRIWDAVFCRGPQAMFQIALAMMKTNESKIAACDEIGGVMEVCVRFDAPVASALRGTACDSRWLVCFVIGGAHIRGTALRRRHTA
jgi:hypothetical protein